MKIDVDVKILMLLETFIKLPIKTFVGIYLLFSEVALKCGVTIKFSNRKKT